MFQKTLILDNSKLNIGAGLTFRQVKELVNGYENIGATLIDFKNFQRDIKCYIGLRDADLFIDRLEKLKATQPQFYFAYDVDPQNRLTKFFWADATCIRNYSFFGDAVSFDPTYGTNKYDMVFTPFTGTVYVTVPLLHCYINNLLPNPCCIKTRFQTAMDQQRYTRRCDDYNSDHSFPELKTELPIEKHGAIIYTHAVFKVFQEEVMDANSCGVDDFEKEEHVRIIHVTNDERDRIFKVRFDLRSTDAVCECKLFERIGLLCRHIVWVYKGKGIGRIPSKYIVDRWLNNTHATNRLDSNGNVIDDSYMATSNNSHLCNVWSEFCQIVGVLKTLPTEHTEDSSSEVTIHPPEQACNKGSGKRLKSAKQQAIEKAAKPKRLCAYCKERVTHDRRTCPLRIVDEPAEKAAKKKKSLILL
ncbi:protein FAR-RED IMPAIRED RESPONSE 1-like [Silene latifolia]|uniref:protein FAR-RED IMPAIRED RESPONSE 1-like n=1 Tax=Silene latifolia TaxID=37657 RepID=UPI003D770A78